MMSLIGLPSSEFDRQRRNGMHWLWSSASQHLFCIFSVVEPHRN